MQLDEYFGKTRGVGVLSTADASGRVNAAIYGRPHFMDDGTIAFIMADRLTHANLQSNPSAVFLFRKKAPTKAKDCTSPKPARKRIPRSSAKSAGTEAKIRKARTTLSRNFSFTSASTRCCP
jgi:hypothetical protein